MATISKPFDLFRCIPMPQGNQHDQQVIPEYFQEGKDSPHEITPIPR
jgi:hypothetical protein